MKTKIIIPIVVLSLILITKSAFAENEAVTGTSKVVRSQAKEEVREVRQDAKVTITQVRDEKKNTISELKLKKVEAIYKGIKMGLEKRHAALLKIKAKLDARIAKNPMKKNTATAVKKLEEFNLIDLSYTNHLQILDNKFEQIKSSSTKTSGLVNELKIIVDIIRKDLNDMKTILKDATVLLAQAPKSEVTKTN